MKKVLPTKIIIPSDLMDAIQAEAEMSDLKPHRLCLQMVHEGIIRRETRHKLQPGYHSPKESTDGIFA